MKRIFGIAILTICMNWQQSYAMDVKDIDLTKMTTTYQEPHGKWADRYTALKPPISADFRRVSSPIYLKYLATKMRDIRNKFRALTNWMNFRSIFKQSQFTTLDDNLKKPKSLTVLLKISSAEMNPRTCLMNALYALEGPEETKAWESIKTIVSGQTGYDNLMQELETCRIAIKCVNNPYAINSTFMSSINLWTGNMEAMCTKLPEEKQEQLNEALKTITSAMKNYPSNFMVRSACELLRYTKNITVDDLQQLDSCIFSIHSLRRYTFTLTTKRSTIGNLWNALTNIYFDEKIEALKELQIDSLPKCHSPANVCLTRQQVKQIGY